MGKQLGNTEEGDGWQFRGRGLIQLTGRGNYTKINAYCTRYKELGDIVLHSDLVTEISMAVFSSMAYWHNRSIYNYANGKKDTEAACDKVGDDVKVKDEEGKDSMNHAEKQKMFDKYSSVAFHIDECLWGEVKDDLQFEVGDGVLAKMKKIADKHYVYKQETNRYRTEVSEKGLEFMDCSELVSRYLYELEIGINKEKNEPIYMTTSDMATQKTFRNKLGNENIDLVGKEESFKPQRGDIFAWGFSSSNGGWNGHTGIVYKYDEKKDLVTILEAIGKSGSADESNNKPSNGGYVGKKCTRTSVYKRTSKALVNHKGWFGYYRPKNYKKKL